MADRDPYHGVTERFSLTSNSYTYAPQVLHVFGNALGWIRPHISERVSERIRAVPERPMCPEGRSDMGVRHRHSRMLGGDSPPGDCGSDS
jgi:hypothetical protein